MNSKDPVYSAHEEPVPVKVYFYRRAHAQEFLAELHRLGVADAKFSQTFTGGAERWMIATDYRVFAAGAALNEWLPKAVERWKPVEDKLA